MMNKTRTGYAVGSLLQDDMAMMNEEDMPTEETQMMPDGTEMPGATYGEGEMMTDEAPEEDMAPDEEMEKEFLDFILDEALTPEEEEMLMSRLEQDEELAMLFDKVIDVAQEFAGSGPVEGPGSGVSDSIPARLSDGEFVFTAAAVEEIGADNLMAMMKEAEMKAEERQGLAEGGLPEEETVTMEVQEQKEPKVQIAKAAVNSIRGLLDEDEVSKGVKSNMMLDPLQRHVRS
jgi:signal recognition particle subunit SEC65